jgi:hypothetical protein
MINIIVMSQKELSPSITLVGEWKIRFDRFQEIGYFKDSPDDDLSVHRIFHSLSQAGVEVPPNVAIWRQYDENKSDSEDEVIDGCEDLLCRQLGYYCLKWDILLLLLYTDRTGEIVSFPIGGIRKFLSEEEIVCCIQQTINSA